MHINKKTEYSLVLNDNELIALAKVLCEAETKLEFRDITPDNHLVESIIENIKICARDLI